MDRPTLLDEMRAFMEADYVTLYPDIGEAIQIGEFASA
jgi:hypothetical protein